MLIRGGFSGALGSWAASGLLVMLSLCASCSEAEKAESPREGTVEWATQINKLSDSLDVALGRGGTAEVRKIMDEVLELAPPDSMKATMYCNIGNIKFTQDDYDSAVFFYERALGFDPTSGARWGLAAAYAKVGRPDGAKEQVELGLETSRRTMPQYLGFFVHLDDSSYSDLMLSVTSRLLEEESDDLPGAHYWRGYGYLLKGEPEAAVMEFVAEIEGSRNRHDEPIMDLERGIYMNPAYNACRELTYIAERGAGDTDQAIFWLNEATRIDPDYPGAWFDLGRFYYKRGGEGDEDLGNKQFDKVRELAPNSPYIRAMEKFLEEELPAYRNRML